MRQRREVSADRIAKVAGRLKAIGVPFSVRLEIDGSAVLLTGEAPVVLTAVDPVDDELAAWRAKRDGQGGPARSP